MNLPGRIATPVGGFAAVAVALPLLAALTGLTQDDDVVTRVGSSVADVPAELLEVYFAAASRCPGLPWPVLAAIGKVESDHGRINGGQLQPDGTVSPPIVGPPLNGTAGTRRIADTDNGSLDGDTTWDRAVGPMQFIPTTWRTWSADGNGDGIADPHNAHDAIHAAAGYLCSAGAGAGPLDDAIFAYNHSWEYVAQVLDVAGGYASAYTATLASYSTSGDAAALLAHPNVTLTPNARADLEAGIIDPRMVQLLSTIASNHQIGISVFKTGHSKHIAGTQRISRHWCGRGADIWMVDAQPVTPRNANARAIVEWLKTLPRDHALRPTEIGQPWSDLLGGGVFADSMHLDHLHFGFTPPCPS